MKRYILVIFGFLILVLTMNLFLGRAFAHGAGTHTIKVDEDGFYPKNITIEVGESIVFENIGKVGHWPASNIHPTHEIYSEFDPKKEIEPRDKWIFKFDKVGIFRMHDHLFPMFVGEITVKSGPEAKVVKGRASFFQQIVIFFTNLFQNKEKIDSFRYDERIQEDDVTISNDKDALYSYVKKFGVAKSVVQLASVESAQGKDCHEDAHSLGKYAYEIYGNKTFGMCSAECHSGCYHGATEAFFKENGTNNLQKNLGIVCSSELNKFFSHQCIHGVGHGLMAYDDYEINSALKECDLLDQLRESCYSGVFMENIVGALAVGESSEESSLDRHYTKYLNDDPLYPCTVVEEKYKNACYFYQTSRMTQIFNYDFAKIARACEGISVDYQQSCFESMGRDVGGFTLNSPKKSILLCKNAKEGLNRIDCLEGAVQNAFWDPSGKDTALEFCKLLQNSSEKESCYSVIVERSTQVLVSKVDQENFCKKLEPGYVVDSCVDNLVIKE